MADLNGTTGSAGLAEQAAEAAAITAEQLAEYTEAAQKELKLVGKVLRTGNRDAVVSQYLVGMHSVRFVNLSKKVGRARSAAITDIERELTWWVNLKEFDANLFIRTYAAIRELHGDITPPGSDAKGPEKKAWAELVDSLPPVGHFHKAYAQLVERTEVGGEEVWTLLVGFEDRAKGMYAAMQSSGAKLKDEVVDGKVVEKGITTLMRELMVEYNKDRAERLAKEAAAKLSAKEKLEDEAKKVEDKAKAQQGVLTSVLEQAAKEADPASKAKLNDAAKEAREALDKIRADMRAKIDAANAVAKEARTIQAEAVDAEKKAEKGEAKLEKRKEQATAPVEVPWQKRGIEAAKKSSPVDMAEALASIVNACEKREDVAWLLMTMVKDVSKRFEKARSAFGTEFTAKVAVPA